MTKNEALEKAANLLEDKGWTQGALARLDDGIGVFSLDERAVSYCIIGAIECASEDDWDLCNEIYDAIRLLIPEERYSIVQWNNDPTRTKEEVIAILRAAKE